MGNGPGASVYVSERLRMGLGRANRIMSELLEPADEPSEEFLEAKNDFAEFSSKAFKVINQKGGGSVYMTSAQQLAALDVSSYIAEVLENNDHPENIEAKRVVNDLLDKYTVARKAVAKRQHKKATIRRALAIAEQMLAEG